MCAILVILFDEIQEAPRAIMSLKYFCEQAREYHVAAAGSYMGISMRRQGESFPVGKVDMLTLRPLCFEEYVRARAGEPLADALHRADFELLGGIGQQVERLLREYLVVGGMPEVVARIVSDNDFAEARRLQQGILMDYDADFGKHAPARVVERMRLVWGSLAGQLARENKKFVYGAVRPGARAKDFEESIQWLVDYGAVRKVPRASALRVPLTSYEDVSAFKLFGLDVGLLGAMSHLEPSAMLDGLRLFTEFKGALTEQCCRNSSNKGWIRRIGHRTRAPQRSTSASKRAGRCCPSRSRRAKTCVPRACAWHARSSASNVRCAPPSPATATTGGW